MRNTTSQRIAAALTGLMLWLAASAAHAQFDHQHAIWAELLKKHVVSLDGGKATQVAYQGMARDRSQLKTYLDGVSGVPETEFKAWSKDQQLAFLINAYNAYMVELILTRYPNIKSVWDFGKVFNNPFRNRFFTLFGRPASLDIIEHETIRADGVYNDPRIHFAVNCASVGCPALREEPYVAARLEQQLEEQTRRFLSDRSRNRYNPATRVLEVSKIFDTSPWYAGDFSRGWKGYRSREAFFANYAQQLADTPEGHNAVRDQQAAIRHLEYDWALNDLRK